MGGEDHRCAWRERVEQLEGELATTRAELAASQDKIAGLAANLEKLQRHVFGQRSEKMPRVADELRQAGVETDPEATQEKRRENAEKRRQLPTRRIDHKVPEAQRTCPKCGGHDFTPLGEGKLTEIFELVPSRVERQLHVQEKLRCRCGETILLAEGPAKVFDKTRFGPNFMAQVVVSKCADSIPLYRQAKAYRRIGVPVDDSTLGNMFHHVAEITAPLSNRLLEIIPEKDIVLADETTQRVQAKKKTRTAWLWSFIARDEREKELIGYVFSKSRSGETPVKVLADTIGKLLVDGYQGYDGVIVPGGRVRAGCIAHSRRKFFEALSSAPEAARKAMDYVLEIYKVERAALDAGLLGTPQHLAMRQARSKPVMEEFKAWLEAEQPRHPPKSAIGSAISYALGQWDALTLFLTDPHLPVDNNASENALRVAALGRTNFLFVGNDTAGEHLAGLDSLVMTCEANGVNPIAYLADVLMRVQTHPASRIDELLPQNWTPPGTGPSA